MKRSGIRRGKPWRFTAEERREVHRLHGEGVTPEEISRRLGRSSRGVRLVLEPGKARPYERKCAQCGENFRGTHSTQKYCSHKCYLEAPKTKATRAKMSASQKAAGNGIGRKNGAYKHGRRMGDVYHVFNLKLKGEDLCRCCGKRARHAHHAVPRSLSRAGREDLRNCLPLCQYCHMGWHRGYVTIHRDVFAASEWAFIITLIGEHWLDKRYPEAAA